MQDNLKTAMLHKFKKSDLSQKSLVGGNSCNNCFIARNLPIVHLNKKLMYLKFVFIQPTDHCVKSVRIRSYSGPYFPAFGLNTLLIQSECGKMRTRTTPNTDTFYG